LLWSLSVDTPKHVGLHVKVFLQYILSVWLQFSENLLMTAIRAGQEDMAEFLMDNRIDHSFTTTRIVSKHRFEIILSIYLSIGINVRFAAMMADVGDGLL